MKTLYLSGVVGWDIKFDKLRSEIDPKSKEKLRIFANSPGGRVYEGFDIYNLLSSYKGEIEFIVGSMVGSAMSYILMAIPLKNRKAFPNSSVMIHESKGGTYGSAKENQTVANILSGMNSVVADAYSLGMGLEKSEVVELMRDDFFMTGGDALLENGVVSEIIEPGSIEFPKKEDDPNGFDFLFGLQNKLESRVELSVATQEMYAAEEKTIEDFKDSNFLNKMVAQMTDFKPEPKVENKIKKGGDMEFKEYLKANPKAMAEYEKDLLDAKAEGKKEAEVTGVKEAVVTEQVRMVAILKASGLVIPELALNALEAGMTPGDFAMEIVSKQNEMRSGKKDDIFGKLKTDTQLPSGQAKEGADTVKSQTDIEADAKAELEDINSGGKYL